MVEIQVSRFEGSPFLKYVGPVLEIFNYLSALGLKYDSQVAWRWVRGSKSTTKPALLDEWSAAWQFPPYFGYNWDAFNDCLTDLKPLAKMGYVTLVSEAHLLLSKEKEDALRDFSQLIDHVANYWKIGPRKKPRRFFTLILQTDLKNEEPLVQLWNRLGHSLEKV